MPARCVVLPVRCPGPLGSCSPVCSLGVLCCVLRCPGPLGSCSPVCPLGALCRVCVELGHLAPVHRCARSVCFVACAVSWATWLLFTSVPARCVVLRVWCPGPLGSCASVCSLGALCCVCGVRGHLAPFHRCARLLRCVVVRCPGPLGSCSPVCPRDALCCMCGVLSHFAPVLQCACSARCVACAVSWATWFLFIGVLAWCAVLRLRCTGPLSSCSPLCSLRALFCVCGVLGRLAPLHRCSRSACCVACAVSWATWLLFTGVSARCVALPVCGVLGHLAPVHRSTRLVCCVACAVSWATWLLFTSVPARCVVLRVCGVLGHLASVHRCAPLARCVACAVSWATWLLFTDAHAWCVVLLCGVLGHLAPVHRCACSLLVLRVPCLWPLGSCSSVFSLGSWC